MQSTGQPITANIILIISMLNCNCQNAAVGGSAAQTEINNTGGVCSFFLGLIPVFVFCPFIRWIQVLTGSKSYKAIR